MLRSEKKLLSHFRGLKLSESSLRYFCVCVWNTMRFILRQLSAPISYASSSRLQSIVEVKFFLSPSEGRSIFHHGVPRLGTWKGPLAMPYTWFHSFLCLFMYLFIHLFPSENKPGLCEWEEWELSWFKTQKLEKKMFFSSSLSSHELFNAYEAKHLIF